MNTFGIIILNTIFNYLVYKYYNNTFTNESQMQEKDQTINELLERINSLEEQLLRKNDFIARELRNEINCDTNDNINNINDDTNDDTLTRK